MTGSEEMDHLSALEAIILREWRPRWVVGLIVCEGTAHTIRRQYDLLGISAAKGKESHV